MKHAAYTSPLAITEMLLRQPPPFTAGMVVNRPRIRITHAFRLFQARMWREYAQDWDRPTTYIQRQWVERVLCKSRSECLRRARVNLYLASRLRRQPNGSKQAEAE